MRSFLLRAAAALALFPLAAGAHAQSPARPKITGISHMAVYSADLAASDRFYRDNLGARKAADPENPAGAAYYFSPRQYIELLPLPAGQGINRLAHVAYITDDAAGMRRYLLAHGVKTVSEVHHGAGGVQWIETRDPENNAIQFVQPGRTAGPPVPGAISHHIIHTGFLVHDSAAENRFYRTLLGFRPYWFGAMKPGNKDWISQQVPDGTDWLEYMMVGPGSGTPNPNVDARTLGVFDHFSLGVANMEKSVTTLIAGNHFGKRHDGPQMGLDGKWQTNIYDPDGTRVELMEFQPVMKPCCSPFTAASPRN